MTPEREIQDAVLRYLATLPNVRAFRRNVGAAMTPTGRRIQFGVRGMADIWGFIEGGKLLEIEVKAPGGRLSVHQVAWGNLVRRFGGIYILARSVEDVELALRPFLGGAAAAAAGKAGAA